MNALERLRNQLARADALLPLALVGVASGFASGGVILAFRLLTESVQVSLLGLADPEGYEALPVLVRLGLPVAGGVAIGVVFLAASMRSRQVGVIHVMEHLAYHSGRLPLRNALMQFFAGALSLVAGHSMGREGPVIHLGSAASSLLGQWFRLPNNSLRTLVACGTAGAIGASFNTPIAGVIFAMEVVLMEYTVAGFAPVILAAVVATSLTHAVYGNSPAFDVPALHLVSLWELPFVLLVGFVCGALSSSFVRGVRALDSGLKHIPLWARTTLAGLVTGVCALAVPEVMGIGYDTVERALRGELLLATLAAITVTKLFASAVCVSMGLPGGLIGPTLVIGATAGGALGLVGHAIAPEMSASGGLYAMLGMGAMMGAVLQAPLAALMCLLELTANPGIVMPAMLAIVAATLGSRLAFGQDSIFVTMLRDRGLDYRFDPVAVALERTGVAAVMSRRTATLDRGASVDDARAAHEAGAEWFLIVEADAIVAVLSAKELAARIERAGPDAPLELAGAEPEPLATVRLQASLRDALDRLAIAGGDVVLVTRTAVAMRNGVYGVLSRDRIEASVRYSGR